MISNPNANASPVDVLESLREPDEDVKKIDDKVGAIRTRRAVSQPNYDEIIDSTFGYIETKIVNVDAKIFEGRGRNQRLNHYRSLREFSTSPTFRGRIKEAIRYGEIKELKDRMQQLGESMKAEAKQVAISRIRELGGNSFDLGLYPDESAGLSGNRASFPVNDVVLPTTMNPYSKQMLFVDYLDMHRKAFEAATRNPLGKRICKLIPQFVLGRSLLATVHENDEYQDVWDRFWKDNKMKLRIKQIFKELLIYGEIFLRYFRQPQGLAIRSLDPSTIWDIVTNPDDLEDVYFYHQQYVITNLSPVAYIKELQPPSTLIIRQIPASDIDHYKINSTSSEKRGRSELFAILGYLLRFRQFVDDRILLNKMRAMFALDVSVKGQQRDVDNAEAQFAQPPNTGSVLIHNENIEIDFKTVSSSDHASATADAELFLKIIATGAGVSETFLGVGAGTSRTGALIQTEPDVKNFEDYQERVQVILEDCFERVADDSYERFGTPERDEDTEIAITFPSIAQEDRSSKLKDIGFSESMGWFSKRRAANMAADEFKQASYDYDDEQETIREESQEDPVIAQSMLQGPKGPIEAPGTVLPAEGSGEDAAKAQDDATGSEDSLKQPGAQTGSVVRSDAVRAIPGKNTSLRRGTSSRKDMKKEIRASGSTAPRGGWHPAARLASIAARQKKAEQRRMTDNNGQES